MRVMVVGASSGLARSLIPALEGFSTVVTAGRHGTDVALDLARPAEAIVVPQGIDTVVNAAARAGTDEALLDLEVVNALGALKLCEASAAAGVGRLVHISSLFTTLPASSPFHGAYALSKRHGEDLVRMACHRNRLPLAILRPSRLYGVGPAQRRNQPLLGTIIERAATGADIEFHGRHDALRNFLHADDFAQLVVRTLRQGLEGCFDCPGRENLRLTEIAGAAIAAFSSASRVRFCPDLPDLADCDFAPDAPLYEALDWRPRIGMAEGMCREAAARQAGR